MRLEDFDYHLPENLIAQTPPERRGASRMLYVDGPDRRLRDGWFREFPQFIEPGDVVVLNDTRVIRARLRGTKATGGRVEVLVERILDDREVLAQVSASHSPGPGSRLSLGDGLEVEVLGREGEFFRLAFTGADSVMSALEKHGQIPLPPYIERAASAQDDADYQTVYGWRPGAVAAPTAGLHFTNEMLGQVRETGATVCHVTLHVGAGTFQPVRVSDLSEHRMHSERFEVPSETVEAISRARREGGRVVAVGTTSVRALESVAAKHGELVAAHGETDLFITPGFEFRVTDLLLTNFHLPRSTLLMLVSAFGGTDLLRRAYAHAVEQAYRFFSYGDAMLIRRSPPGKGH
ncbi:MAG: tRNA preQ1(34) S-adenosylmethionine ribosyltransferase-isomerase QueA [Betaproteobacteria bacterium]|nr:tRNA preQ1(34) S-adenosylmethionine ribosyltransferase-isomerase QueA [Betaproteobacteria bacterium]